MIAKGAWERRKGDGEMDRYGRAGGERKKSRVDGLPAILLAKNHIKCIEFYTCLDIYKFIE